MGMHEYERALQLIEAHRDEAVTLTEFENGQVVARLDDIAP